MSKSDLVKIADSFRHAILYLRREANNSGFANTGQSLEHAERALDRDVREQQSKASDQQKDH